VPGQVTAGQEGFAAAAGLVETSGGGAEARPVFACVIDA
jgi:hypothetical protein